MPTLTNGTYQILEQDQANARLGIEPDGDGNFRAFVWVLIRDMDGQPLNEVRIETFVPQGEIATAFGDPEEDARNRLIALRQACIAKEFT